MVGHSFLWPSVIDPSLSELFPRWNEPSAAGSFPLSFVSGEFSSDLAEKAL